MVQGCRPCVCQGCHGTPDFVRSVNPISTRGTDYAHLITTATTGFSDLLMTLWSSIAHYYLFQDKLLLLEKSLNVELVKQGTISQTMEH